MANNIKHIIIHLYLLSFGCDMLADNDDEKEKNPLLRDF